MGDGILTDADERDLAYNREQRNRMISSKFDKGVPDTIGEMRVMNEILNSSDDTIIKLAALRAKNEENATNSKIMSMVTTVIKENVKRRNTEAANNASRIVEIDDEFIPDDTVAGETDIGINNLKIEDFVKKDDSEED